MPVQPVLTRRQIDVLALLTEGLTNREISTRLWISEKTVKQHLFAAYRRLGVSNRTAAAVAFVHLGTTAVRRLDGGVDDAHGAPP